MTASSRRVRLQAYLPPDLVERVTNSARSNYRTLSQEVERLLVVAINANSAAE